MLTRPRMQRPSLADVMLLVAVYGITAMLAVSIISGRMKEPAESDESVNFAVPRVKSTAHHLESEVIVADDTGSLEPGSDSHSR